MTTNPATVGPRTASVEHRSRLGTIVLVLTTLSILAFVVLIVGSVLDWKGFSSAEDDVSAFADMTWSTFALGGLLALVAGTVAWARGRRTRSLGDVRAGQLAAGWVILAVAISAIWSAVD